MTTTYERTDALFPPPFVYNYKKIRCIWNGKGQVTFEVDGTLKNTFYRDIFYKDLTSPLTKERLKEYCRGQIELNPEWISIANKKAPAKKPAPKPHSSAKKAAYVAAYGKRHRAYERAEASKHPFGLTPRQHRGYTCAMEKPMNGEKIESEEEYWLRQPESEYEQTLAKSKATHKPRAPARKKPAPGKATPKRKPAVKKSPTTKRKSSIRSPSHTPAKKPAPKATGKPRVLKASKIQTGKSDKKRDAARKAMPPGKRKSATGRVYYEYRKNRSDVRGRKT